MKRRLVRIAAPAAFLAAVTIAVLLVRDGLREGDDASTATTTIRPATTREPTTTTARPRPPRQRTYIVQAGDTLDQIALDFDTTVARLLALNPGVEATDLRVGQRLRVP